MFWCEPLVPPLTKVYLIHYRRFLQVAPRDGMSSCAGARTACLHMMGRNAPLQEEHVRRGLSILAHNGQAIFIWLRSKTPRNAIVRQGRSDDETSGETRRSLVGGTSLPQHEQAVNSQFAGSGRAVQSAARGQYSGYAVRCAVYGYSAELARPPRTMRRTTRW